MQKKNLQIETNFLDGDDDFEVEAIRQEKCDIVQFLEKKLSCILARNFIECWEQIKECRFRPKGSRINEQKYLTQNYIQTYNSKHKVKTQEIQERIHSRNNSRENKYRVRTVHYVQSPHADSRKYRARSHKKHTEAGEERANVLQQIVQKLKASHQRNDLSGDVGVEVLRKVSRLERMMRDIKSTNHTSKVLIKEFQTRQPRDTDQDETVRMFVDEIRDIRKQLAGIKHTNEEFIKAQLEAEINRSRATERDNNFGHVEHDQPIGTGRTTNFNEEKTFIHGLSEIHKTQKISPKNYPNIFPPFESKPFTIPNHISDFKFNPQPTHSSNYYSHNYSSSYGLSNPNIRFGNFNNSPAPTATNQYLNPSSNNKPSSTFNYQTPSYNSNSYSYDTPSLNTGGFKYNSGGNISTSTTFGSFPSAQGQFKPLYPEHTRNPSIEKRQEESSKPKPWELPGYCSSCGRSCGCQRNFRPAGEQRYY